MLYRNRGAGAFQRAPLDLRGDPPGAGLGVVTADFDGDGWIDAYVANDQGENHLWMNRGAAGDGSVEDFSAPRLDVYSNLDQGRGTGR